CIEGIAMICLPENIHYRQHTVGMTRYAMPSGLVLRPSGGSQSTQLVETKRLTITYGRWKQMKHYRYLWLVALTTLSFSGIAQADIVVHEIGSTAANTLNSLGSHFVTGCIVIAVAAIICAAMAAKGKKKE
ncbi:MAG TPA: hypothetical protein PLY86_03895, partial [bacterium]|nr:hypothetical protein [bacterium]